MARFNAETIDNYGGSGGSTNFFKLSNDHDVALVRFLYNSADDVDGFAVHEVQIDGKRRYVNCLREYNQPIDDCPFCRAKMFQVAKLYIPLYNEDLGEVQVWERGKTFFNTLSSTLSRYDKKPIVSQLFEVERIGKAKDTKTIYQIFRTEDDADDTKLEDFDMPEVLGRIILDKSAEDMEFYLENEYFPPEEGSGSRRSSRRRDEEPEEDESPRRRETSRRTGRRTPSDSF